LQHSNRPVTHEGHTLFSLFSFALGDVGFSSMVLCDPCRRGIKIQQYVVQTVSSAENVTYPQSSSKLWNYSKCGVYTVEGEAGC
jgi:hypothetical protein